MSNEQHTGQLKSTKAHFKNLFGKNRVKYAFIPYSLPKKLKPRDRYFEGFLAFSSNFSVCHCRCNLQRQTAVFTASFVTIYIFPTASVITLYENRQDK